MPRKPIGPVEAQAKAKAHALKAVESVAFVMTILDGENEFPDEQRGNVMRDAAKAIEAAGCYIRRAHADHLLIP
jgi:hypothetical protein